jgi:hypothetical protein
MRIEEQAINVLEYRCRYCGAMPDAFHEKHCNVVLSQRIDDLVSNINYSLNELSRKSEAVNTYIQIMANTISQNSQYELFLRHTAP